MSLIRKRQNCVRKAARFGELQKPFVRAGVATEGLCSAWQLTQRRAEWQLPVKVFKTLLYSSQSLYLCATHFGKMLRLIRLHQKLQHCFTGTWDFDTTSWHPAEVQVWNWLTEESTQTGASVLSELAPKFLRWKQQFWCITKSFKGKGHWFCKMCWPDEHTWHWPDLNH